MGAEHMAATLAANFAAMCRVGLPGSLARKQAGGQMVSRQNLNPARSRSPWVNSIPINHSKRNVAKALRKEKPRANRQ